MGERGDQVGDMNPQHPGHIGQAGGLAPLKGAHGGAGVGEQVGAHAARRGPLDLDGVDAGGRGALGGALHAAGLVAACA